MQQWLDDVYLAPYMVDASTPSDDGAPYLPDPNNPTIQNGVIAPAFVAWFPSYGRLQLSQFLLNDQSTPPLKPGSTSFDYILSHDGTGDATGWHLDQVNPGYPPYATLTATPPRLLIARITCSSAGITAIYDIRARHPAPHNPHYIDLVALGADPTGVQDSTAAVQAALDMAAKGDGTCIIIVPPNSRFLICGQLVVFGNNRAENTTFNIANGIWLIGSPHGGQHQDIIAGGSILDMRWDGGLGISDAQGAIPLEYGSPTGLQTVGDHCVVTGYALSLGTYDRTTGIWSGPFAITSEPHDHCRAYINNQAYDYDDGSGMVHVDASHAITTLAEDPGDFDLLSNIPANLIKGGSYSKWYLDVDKAGNIYATQDGQWTDTSLAYPKEGTYPSWVVGNQGSGGALPLSGGDVTKTFGQSKTPDTIRVWAIYCDGAGNILDYEDNRAFTGKLDDRTAGEVRIEGLAFSAGYRGQWDPHIQPPYQIGDWVSWEGQPYRLDSTTYANQPPTTPQTGVGSVSWTVECDG